MCHNFGACVWTNKGVHVGDDVEQFDGEGAEDWNDYHEAEDEGSVCALPVCDACGQRVAATAVGGHDELRLCIILAYTLERVLFIDGCCSEPVFATRGGLRLGRSLPLLSYGCS